MHEQAGAEGLRQIEPVAGPRSCLRPDRVRRDRADDGEPVFRLLLAQRVTAREDPACLARPWRRRRRRSPRGRSPGSDSGNEAIDSASSGRPPIAKTSLSAFVAAIAPNAAGSSTIGGKKSSVNTIACRSSIRYTAASSDGASPTSRSGSVLGRKAADEILKQRGRILCRAPAAGDELGQPNFAVLGRLPHLHFRDGAARAAVGRGAAFARRAVARLRTIEPSPPRARCSRRRGGDHRRRRPGQPGRALLARGARSRRRHGCAASINATGVVLHTNLGRAPLAAAALDHARAVASGYSNLEYDLAEGRRGSRHDHLAAILRRLTGAEDALIVNNNAAALLLCPRRARRGPGGRSSRAAS